MQPDSFFGQQAWFDFQNTDATLMPAFGVGIIADVKVVSADELTAFKIAQPSSYGSQYNAVINGPVDVPANSYGRCTRSGVVLALYDSSDGTPQFGDAWGPRSGTWKLKKNTGGFFCLGAPTNTTLFLALFAPMPFLRFRGTADADIAIDATGTVSIFYRSGATAYTDTTVNATALNDLDAIVKGGSDIECVYEPYQNAGVYTEGWKTVQSDFSC